MSVPAAYLGVMLVWATTPLAIQWSAQGGGFLFGVAARMVIGALVCLLLMFILRVPLPWHRRARHTYLAAAGAIYGAMLSVYWAAQYIPSGWISVLFGLTPLVTSVLSVMWLGERGFTLTRFFGLLLGLAGLVLIFGCSVVLGEHAVQGMAAMLLSVSLHSASMLMVKRLDAGLPALAVTGGGLLCALPLYLLTWLAVGSPVPDSLPLSAGLAIVYLGVFGSVLGFVMFYYLLKHLDAIRLALITLITPVLALLLGHVFNGEAVAGMVWTGTALIMGGLVLHQYDDLRKLGKRRCSP